jgi:hypothetical protein
LTKITCLPSSKRLNTGRQNTPPTMLPKMC